MFEKTLQECRYAYNKQVGCSLDYTQALKKIKMYMSHFIQVIYLAVLRNDMREEDINYYGLSRVNMKVPSFNTESAVIRWGEKLIKGETERLNKGLTPVSNPSIALVKVRYENFLELHRNQKVLQKNVIRHQHKLKTIREDANKLIVQIWNDVENHFSKQPDKIKRSLAKSYGLVYVYRKNEKRPE